MVSDMQIDNVYVIDTNMFGFPNYQSCYLVEGGELILIDTGLPSQIDSLYSGIEKHGFSVNEISKIILTHCEHPDHAGNVGTLVKENPDIQVYIHPEGLEYLTEPSIESENRKKVMLPQMAARFGEQIPVPNSRICFLENGQTLYLHDFSGNRLPYQARLSRNRLVWEGNDYSMSKLASTLLKKEGYKSNEVQGPARWFTDNGVSILQLWEQYRNSTAN